MSPFCNGCMEAMFRALSLLLLLAATTGCKSPDQPVDQFPNIDPMFIGLRCSMIAGEKPFVLDNLRYIERSADNGDATCKVILGKMYQEGGHGVDQDYRQARKLFVESAKLDPSNNILLGRMAERGEGEPVDYAKAREFYRLAGKTAVVQLGRLMEEGKGGPQDLPGAFALYLESVDRYSDDAWKAVSRMRKQGQPLNQLQAQRYQQIWLSGFITRQNNLLAVRKVLDKVDAAGEVRKPTLSYRFKADGGVPQVTMTKSSGDATLDTSIMEAMSRFNMGDSGPITDDSGELQIIAPLVFTPKNPTPELEKREKGL